VFAELGTCRDSDVLDSGVVASLAKVGAPPLSIPSARPALDPAAFARSDDVQRVLLACLSWRTAVSAARPVEPAPEAPSAGSPARAPARGAVADRSATHDDARDAGRAVDADTKPPKPWSFESAAERRLKRWHRSIADVAARFDELDETAMHALRKRIKRQRYAIEFFAPLVGLRRVDRYLKPLAAVQERMGELNDLFVARTRYEALVRLDPAAWFALGWLAARIAETRARTGPDLQRLAAHAPPKR
jgi:CHAD domain-containing protein